MVNKLFLFFIFFLSLTFFHPTSALAAIITVSPGESIQTKCANVLQPGETCQVNAGVYNEIVTETTSGSAGNLIRYIANNGATIKGFNLNGNYIELNGFTVTPTGTCQVNWNGAIQSSGSNNLIVNNTVKDSIITGLKLTPTSHSNTVSHNTIVRANVDGMTINGNDHVVESNDISDIRNMINGCNWWGDTNAITFFGSGNVFRKNYIHNMFKDNQSGKPHVDAFQTHTAGHIAASNTVIEQNHIFMGNDSTGQIEGQVTDTQGFHAFMIEGSKTDVNNWARNITIKNNIIESRHGLNIGGGGGNVANLKIYNNVLRGDVNSTTAWPTGLNISGVTGFEIFNNIFVDFMYSHITVKNGSTGGSTNNNIMWNSNGSTPGLEGYQIQPGDKRGIDPKFVNNLTNFHLQQNSPAINAGITLSAVTNDYEGIPRPQGAGYDIGAYEYQSDGISPTTVPTITPTNPPIIVKLGDTEPDNDVDNEDYNVWLNNRFKPLLGPSHADFNSDSIVNGVDYVIWLKNYGK